MLQTINNNENKKQILTNLTKFFILKSHHFPKDKHKGSFSAIFFGQVTANTVYL